jgi:hypothetical protein
MDFRNLKARIARLAANIPCASKVRPVLLSWWEACAGGRPVRLPDWPRHETPNAAKPPAFGPRNKARRLANQGPRQLVSICLVYVDETTCSPAGHSFSEGVEDFYK